MCRAFIFRHQFVDFFLLQFCRSFNATDLIASLKDNIHFAKIFAVNRINCQSRERGDLPRAFKIKLSQDLTLEML